MLMSNCGTADGCPCKKSERDKSSAKEEHCEYGVCRQKAWFPDRQPIACRSIYTLPAMVKYDFGLGRKKVNGAYGEVLSVARGQLGTRKRSVSVEGVFHGEATPYKLTR